MFRIAYRSTLHAGVGEAEIASIARQAAEQNQAAGLNGVWVLSGRRCLGALEGDPRVLRHLIETIWDDPRHSGFEVLDMRSRDDALLAWPFLLVRAETLEREPELKDHQALQWLGAFEGGLEAFFASPRRDGAADN
ncbi:MAG: BLUF domain-containing protein [Oceanicaulis sp.]